MEREPRTLEQIQGTIRAARDSVWVIEDTIQQLAEGAAASEELKGNIQRNVDHLKLVTADQEIIDSGENIADLQAAVVTGEAKLAEDIWSTEAE
jgi:DNA/RNA endonuclease YhcR with UshA esterase domain